MKRGESLLEMVSHIIYVNGRYEGNDDIGRMMRDFQSVQAGADKK